MTEKQIVFGTDLGGGIIDKLDEGSRGKFLGPEYLLTPGVPEVFETLRQIVNAIRGKNGECSVHVVSACESSLRNKALWWLNHHQFYDRTGIPRENVRFANSRRVKAEICADLGITHFVDDRLEVLSQLPPSVEKFLFRRDPGETGVFQTFIPKVRLAESWADILGYILNNR